MISKTRATTSPLPLPVQDGSVAIEDASVLVAGQAARERLGLEARSLALARLAVRSTARAGDDAATVAAQLVDACYL